MIDVINAEFFSEEVKLWIQAGTEPIDAVLTCAHKFNVELESIKELISPELKFALEVEAASLNFLPKTARLPI